MLKRLGLLLVVIFVLPFAAFAQSDDAGVASMAGYFPANTVIFGAIRTDEDFLALIESLTDPLVELAEQSGQPTPTLRETLNDGLADVNSDLDSVMAWLGDHAAFGITTEGLMTAGSESPDATFIVELDDQNAAETFFRSVIPADGSIVQRTEGDFTFFETVNAGTNAPVLAIGEDLLLIYPGDLPLPLLTREARLDSNSSFQSAIGALPAESYNALAYIDPTPFIAGMPVDPSMPFTLEAAPFAVGLTILDDRSYVIDSAQLPVAGAEINPPASIDPTFAGFIPGNASAVIQATDLSALLTNLLTVVDELSASSASSADAPPASAQVAGMMAMFGFDLQDDLLSWTTGDYALFGRAELLDIYAELLTGGVPDFASLPDQIDIGLVIEATDPAKAAGLVAKFDTLLQQMIGGQQGVTVGSETIHGVDVTVVSIEAPLDAQTHVQIDVLLGSNDEVFFLATRPAAETILSGDGTLSGNRSYLEAGQYALPNPTTLWYADGEGLVIGTSIGVIIPLALLGPAIGEVFNNVVAELEAPAVMPLEAPQTNALISATPIPTPTLMPLPTEAPAATLDPAAVFAQIEDALTSISSSSISSTVTDEGVTLLRFVITAAQ